MVFPTIHAFCLDTIEETYNMDPPLSIYPKKSPYAACYRGFWLGSLPCNLPRYRVPLTEVYRVTLHGRITDDHCNCWEVRSGSEMTLIRALGITQATPFISARL